MNYTNSDIKQIQDYIDSILPVLDADEFGGSWRCMSDVIFQRSHGKFYIEIVDHFVDIYKDGRNVQFIRSRFDLNDPDSLDKLKSFLN